MKQKYVKPIISIETFSLNQTVAWGCGDLIDFERVNFNSREKCGYEIAPGWVYFISENACSDLSIGEGDKKVVCYNNPDGGWNIFRS